MKTIDKNRRLPKEEYQRYYAYILDKYPICQVCKSNHAIEAHHSRYGAYKDDKTLVSICRQCHQIAHSNKHKWEKLLLPIANENWKKYCKDMI